MKTVLTYGTFDLFHVGHVRLLKRLRSLGDKLIVGCSSDSFNEIKGKKSIFSYSDRAEILSSCRYVDLVFPEDCWEQKVEDVRKYNADIFAMGDDWAGKFDFLAEETGCIVTYISRTPDISTSEVKNVMKSLDQEKISEIVNVLDNLKSKLVSY